MLDYHVTTDVTCRDCETLFEDKFFEVVGGEVEWKCDECGYNNSADFGDYDSTFRY
jgi:hypothetical protein